MPKRPKIKLSKIVLMQKKPNVRLKRMLKRLRNRDWKQKKLNVKLKQMLKKLRKKDLRLRKRPRRFLSKLILLKQMDQKINLNYRNKKHYRKLRRRNLQRRRRLLLHSSSNLLVKIPKHKRLRSVQKKRGLKPKRPKESVLKLKRKLSKRFKKLKRLNAY